MINTIKIVKFTNGFSGIYINDYKLGELEDMDDEVAPIIKKLMLRLSIKNVDVIEQRIR